MAHLKPFHTREAFIELALESLPENALHTFLGTHGYFRRFTGPNRLPTRTAAPARAEILFGPVNPLQNTHEYEELCGVVFRVRRI